MHLYWASEYNDILSNETADGFASLDSLSEGDLIIASVTPDVLLCWNTCLLPLTAKYYKLKHNIFVFQFRFKY